MLTGTLWALWCCLMLVMLLWVSSPFLWHSVSWSVWVLVFIWSEVWEAVSQQDCKVGHVQGLGSMYIAFHAQLVTRISLCVHDVFHEGPFSFSLNLFITLCLQLIVLLSALCLVSDSLSCFQLCVLSPTDWSCFQLCVLSPTDWSCFQLCVLSPTDCLAFSLHLVSSWLSCFQLFSCSIWSVLTLWVNQFASLLINRSTPKAHI